jgi:hypothetical protein
MFFYELEAEFRYALFALAHGVFRTLSCTPYIYPKEPINNPAKSQR